MLRKTIGLFVFLKGSSDLKARMPSCVNYDRHYGGCLIWGDCLVEQGKRCDHFEQNVLPTAADIGQTDRLYSDYEKRCKVPGMLTRAQARICPDCETGLKPRQRFCDKCTVRRRRETRARNQRKFRLSVRSTVKGF